VVGVVLPVSRFCGFSLLTCVLRLCCFCIYDFCFSIWFKTNQRLTTFVDDFYDASFLIQAADQLAASVSDVSHLFHLTFLKLV